MNLRVTNLRSTGVPVYTNTHKKEGVAIKKILIILTMVAILAAIAVPVLAAPAGKDTPANDNPNNLYLYPKDTNWDIVWDGAWGKYNYKLKGTEISGPFNGHGLVPGAEYALVEYLGWPDVVVLGTATADENGNVHIKTDGALAVSAEDDYYKIWLVTVSSLSGDAFIAWLPGDYLFEHHLI